MIVPFALQYSTLPVLYAILKVILIMKVYLYSSARLFVDFLIIKIICNIPLSSHSACQLVLSMCRI